jgi:2-furoate---CoA ligase
MGVRSLLAMSLIGGRFVCLPSFDAARALQLIEEEKLTNLYLVPTLYHDLLHHTAFKAANLGSVRKLAFAGAPMTEGLLRALQDAFKPGLFVNHYGSSEIYTFTIEQNAAAKPGSAGRAGINQMVRVVRLGAASADEVTKAGEEGEVIALFGGDESFEGYWRRPDADATVLRNGWYFTGDTGYFDTDGDLFVTGRVDDMIITGGEHVSPVEIENSLSLHPAVSEVAVVGVADERWGKIVSAFIKRCDAVSPEELDQFCCTSGLANFKRPLRYVFVETIPKSPAGKLLRRKLLAGEYEPERSGANSSRPLIELSECAVVRDFQKPIMRYVIDVLLNGDDRNFSVDTDLIESGILDSRSALRMIIFLNSTFGTAIPLVKFNAENLRTVAAIAKLLDQQLAN